MTRNKRRWRQISRLSTQKVKVFWCTKNNNKSWCRLRMKLSNNDFSVTKEPEKQSHPSWQNNIQLDKLQRILEKAQQPLIKEVTSCFSFFLPFGSLKLIIPLVNSSLNCLHGWNHALEGKKRRRWWRQNADERSFEELKSLFRVLRLSPRFPQDEWTNSGVAYTYFGPYCLAVKKLCS